MQIQRRLSLSLVDLTCKLTVDRSTDHSSNVYSYGMYLGTPFSLSCTHVRPHGLCFLPTRTRALRYSSVLMSMTEHTGAAVTGPSFAVNQ